MNIVIPNNPVFAKFQQNCPVQANINKQSENQQSKKNEKSEKLKKALVLTSAAAGIMTGLILVGKQQKLDVFTKKGYSAIDYSAKAMSTIACCSLVGGVSTGIALDKKNTKYKIREGIQQFVGNIIFPITAVAGGEWIYKNYGAKIKTPSLKGNAELIKGFNLALNRMPRVATTIASLMVGLFIGNKVGNYINNLIFKDKQSRKLEITDASGHLDDFCLGASLVTRGTAISDVVSKFIPPALIVAGYVAGTKKMENAD